jgi:Flp pilus assembly pilin Flp
LEDLTMNRIKLSKRIAGRKSQFGQGMTEYVIIVALVAIGAIAVFSTFGHTLQDQVAAITNGLAGNGSAAQSDDSNAKSEASTADSDASTTLGMDDFAKNEKDQ